MLLRYLSVVFLQSILQEYNVRIRRVLIVQYAPTRNVHRSNNRLDIVYSDFLPDTLYARSKTRREVPTQLDPAGFSSAPFVFRPSNITQYPTVNWVSFVAR